MSSVCIYTCLVRTNGNPVNTQSTPDGLMRNRTVRYTHNGITVQLKLIAVLLFVSITELNRLIFGTGVNTFRFSLWSKHHLLAKVGNTRKYVCDVVMPHATLARRWGYRAELSLQSCSCFLRRLPSSLLVLMGLMGSRNW